MKTLALLFFSMLLPAGASAQQRYIVAEDPTPQTDGCHEEASGFHADGDVVTVERFGQWQNGLQNGSPGYRFGCGIERVVRRRPDGGVAWSVTPSWDEASRAVVGFGKADQIDAIAVLPDGSTLLTTRRSYGSSSAAVVLFDAAGHLRWRTEPSTPLAFSMAMPEIGPNGELFVSYVYTNYGVPSGRFQLPGGRTHTLRAGQTRTLIARLEPDTGALLWEAADRTTLVSAAGGELVALRELGGRRGPTRYEIVRRSYQGRRLSRVRTRPVPREGWVNAERVREGLALTAVHETVQNGRVLHREGVLRVFALDGRQLFTSPVSDQSVVAETEAGAPLRIISPTNNLRVGRTSQTDAVDVFTYWSLDAAPVHARVRIPLGKFAYRGFGARSSREGFWVNAQTYYHHAEANLAGTPAATLLYTDDVELVPVAYHQAVLDESDIWRPDPVAVAAASRPMDEMSAF